MKFDYVKKCDEKWKLLKTVEQSFLKEAFKFHLFYTAGEISTKQYAVMMEEQIKRDLFIELVPNNIMIEIENATGIKESDYYVDHSNESGKEFKTRVLGLM